MNKATKNLLLFAYVIIGVIGIHLLGEEYASKMMEKLAKNPSQDLYANTHDFQYMVFWLPWGCAILFMLLLSTIALNKIINYFSAKNT
jgi:hypothetical protein